MKNKIIIFLLLFPLWIVSCDKEQEPDDEYVYVTLYPELGIEIGESGAQTKAPLTSLSYLYFGINVSKASSINQGDPNDKYHPYYYNIQFYNYSNSLSANNYYTINGQNITRKLPLFKTYGKANIAIWYPYNSSNTDIRAIPFNANTISMPDYLWAPPVEVDPETPATLLRTTHLTHVMTCLSFQIATNYLGTGETGKQTMYLTKIVATTKNGAAWIPQTGTFNAITGEVNVDQYVSTLEYTVNTTLSNNSTTDISLILPDIPLTSGVGDRIINYELHVRPLNSTTNTTTTLPIVNNFDLDLGKIFNTLNQYGLRAGYRYYINIKLDNFTKFTFDPTSIPEGKPWTDNNIDIEI